MMQKLGASLLVVFEILINALGCDGNLRVVVRKSCGEIIELSEKLNST